MDDTLFFRRLDTQAGQYEPTILSAYLKALRALANGWDLAVVRQAMARGDVAGAIDYLTNVVAVRAAFAVWMDAYRSAVISSGRYFTRQIPVTAPAPPVRQIVAVARFDYMRDPVVQAIGQYEDRALRTIREDLQAALTTAVEDGLRRGVNPRQVARELHGILGLAGNQEQEVLNFEQALRHGDLRALTYELRDKRFDRTLRKALGTNGGGLGDAQIGKMVAAYRKAKVAWQAETMTRTVTLNAQRQAQQLAWQQAVDDGRVRPDDLIITWHTRMDGRERPGHAAMHLTTRRWGEPWDVPNAGPERYPGEGEFNCRCRESYTLRLKP